MRLNQEKIQRMFDGRGGVAGGGSSIDPGLIVGLATEAWTEENYVSKTFFNELFVIHKKTTTTVYDGTTVVSTTVDTSGTFAPNEIPSEDESTDSETGYRTVVVTEVDNIEAKKGLWTDFFLSALGLNAGGGSGGIGDVTWQALADNTDTRQIASSHLTTALSTALTGYATQSWVTAQNYVTSSAISDMATKTWVNNQSFVNWTALGDSTITQQIALSHLTTALSGYATQNWVTTNFSTPSTVATQLQTYAKIQNGTITIGDTSLTPITSVTGTFWGKSFTNGGTVNGTIKAGSSGGAIEQFHSIEMNSAGTLSGYGGFIDFHYYATGTTFDSTLDYTSRIIESAVGVISIMAKNNDATNANRLAGLLVGAGYDGSYIQIGDLRIVYDSTNNALKVVKIVSGSEVAANFYATGSVSALGYGAGGGGGTGDVTWTTLADNTDTRPIALSHIQSALSGYATTAQLLGYLPLTGGRLSGILRYDIPSATTIINTYYFNNVWKAALGYYPQTGIAYLDNRVGGTQIRIWDGGKITFATIDTTPYVDFMTFNRDGSATFNGGVTCTSLTCSDTGTFTNEVTAKNMKIPYLTPVTSAASTTFIACWINNDSANGFTCITKANFLSDYVSSTSLATTLQGYLPLTGGTLTGAGNFFTIESTTANTWVYFKTKENNVSANKGAIGYYSGLSFISAANTTSIARIGITDAGVPQYWDNDGRTGTNKYTLLHTGNLSSNVDSTYIISALGYTPANNADLSNYLPLVGGTLSNSLSGAVLTINNDADTPWIFFDRLSVHHGAVGWHQNFTFIGSGYGNNRQRIGVTDDGIPQYWDSAAGTNKYTLLHTGNVTSTVNSSYIATALGYTPANNADLANYLLKSGGTMTGTLDFNIPATTTIVTSYYYNNALKACLGYYPASRFTYIDNRAGGTQIRIKDDGNITFANIGVNPNVDVITFEQSGNATFTGSVSCASLTSSGAISCASLSSTGAVSCASLSSSGTISGTSLTCSDTGTFTNEVTAKNIKIPNLTPVTSTTYIACWIGDNSANGFSCITKANFLSDYIPKDGLYNANAGAITWGTLTSANGYTRDLNWLTPAPSGTTNYGGFALAHKSGAASLQVDGFFYQNEGNYQVIDTSGGTISGAKHTGTNNLLEVSVTDNTDWIVPLSMHAPNLSTGRNTQFNLGVAKSNYNEVAYSFYYAGAGSTSNRTGIGFYGAGEQLVVRADGNVGIGTTAPEYKLHVLGNILVTGSTHGATGHHIQIGTIRIIYVASENALKIQNEDGTAANLYATGGISALGYQSGGGGGGSTGVFSTSITPETTGTYDLGTTTYKWRNLYLAGANGGNGFSIITSYSSYVYIGSLKKILFGADVEFEDTAYVENRMGIGVKNGNYDLYVYGENEGNAYFAGNVSVASLTNRSDMRLKDVVGDVNLSVQQIASAPTFKFRFKEKAKRTMVGTSAQYWDAVLPESVTRDADGILGLDYGVTALVSTIILAKGMTEHERRITKLEMENAELRARIKDLEEN